jgi:transposase
MAAKTIAMSTLKQVLRMYSEGKPIKAIARNCGLSKNTVKKYICSPECRPEELLKLDDKELALKWKKPSLKPDQQRYDDFQSRLEYFQKELKRVGVSRYLLWQEYLLEYPGGYSYTQFCYYIQQQHKAGQLSMSLEHKAADRLYIDFTGKKLSWFDPLTGEEKKAEVLVGCLGYSQKAVVVAVESQRTEHFVDGLGQILGCLGGGTHAIVPDNLKAAVIKSDRYEPILNRVLEDFANHYGTTILPARALHPKDKALAENLVKISYNRIYAPLRNQTFTSLKELNLAIAKQTEKHNQTPFQRKDYCRQQLFESEEQKLLKTLPAEPFQLKKYRSYKVHKNSMILLSEDQHYYSVPYAYIGQQVEVVYTLSSVKVYYKNKPIAAYSRTFKKYGQTFRKEHFPSWHQDYRDRSPDYYRQRASKYSTELQEVISAVLHKKLHPEQMYKSCEGILKLASITPKDTFEKACKMVLLAGNVNYKFLKSLILSGAADHFEELTERKNSPAHANIRGKEFYNQSNI